MARPLREFGFVRILQGVLVLGATDAAVNLNILNGLHEQRDPLNIVSSLTQPLNYFRSAVLALLAAFEADIEPAGVHSRIDSTAAHKGSDIGDVRVLQDDLGDVALPLDHGFEGDRLSGVRDAEDHTGVLL